MNPKVSIIISNRNDVAMLVVTVRSCIEELRPLGKGAGEIVIVDNSDGTVYEMLKSALPMSYCKEGILKIYRQDFNCLFTAREKAIRESSGDYVMCLDSHMIVGRDCIVNLVNFMERHFNNSSLAFAHAPITWAHHHERTARHDRDMSENELGDWNIFYDYEQTITWKGMPWMCRRDWFLDNQNGLGGYGALSEHKISWGGGDMHIGIKPWLLGFKNWAVPTNPCIHIGPFPKPPEEPRKENLIYIKDIKPSNNFHSHQYRLYSDSGNFPHAFGFLVSCYVLGGEEMMQRNKELIAKRFGRYIDIDKWWDKAKELGEDEKQWLDERKVTSFEQLLVDEPWKDYSEFEQSIGA